MLIANILLGDILTKHFCVGKARLSAILLLTFSVLFSLSTTSVMAAAPPKIESLTWFTQLTQTGSSTTVEITIRYVNPPPEAYLDKVEVKVDSKVYTIDRPSRAPAEITVESLELGVITGTPTVQARAHSTVDGWGDWSSAVTIPEFPIPLVVLFLAALTMLALSLKLSDRKPNKE